MTDPEYMERLRGKCGAHSDEWFAGYVGEFSAAQPLYGTFDLPADGEPMLARFHFRPPRHPREGYSAIMAVQRLLPGQYLNCIGGATFAWPDEDVHVLSAASRIGPTWTVHLPHPTNQEVP
ncbi:MAG: hypothetical protein ABT940_13245 [Alphaproteobacteria bacterium]